MGGAQLTGGVELTVGDKLTGGETRLLTRPTQAAMPVHHQTFNMADRGSYACIYGGKLMVTAINHHQPVNVEQSASER